MNNTTTLCTKMNSEKRKITRELLNGHEAATQLKLLLLQNPIGESSLSAKELLANVLRSFNETLSILTLLPEHAGTPAADDSDQCKKKRTATKTGRGRGCYKRRRNSAHTWSIVSPTIDDNYTWRKYGQKQILSSKFPRSYFRCTRKYDEGCRATKQVQKTQENPVMYQTTYTGMHSCKATPNSKNNNVPCLLVNSQDHHHDSKVANEKDYYSIISPLTPTVTQEHAKEDSPSDVGRHKLDPVWSDLKDFEPSNKPSINLEMNFGVDSVHFVTHHDDDFHHFDAFLAS